MEVKWKGTGKEVEMKWRGSGSEVEVKCVT